MSAAAKGNKGDKGTAAGKSAKGNITRPQTGSEYLESLRDDRTDGGSTEEIRRYCLFGAQASGNADRFKGFAEECMAEYDLDGWKVPDLTDPGELSYHVMRNAKQ